MLQWIAALERVARESHYTGKNRFDSFAPIRLNVAAQWLVDGVRSRISSWPPILKLSTSVTTSGISRVQSCLRRNLSIFTTGGCLLVSPSWLFLDLSTHMASIAELQLRRPRQEKYRLDHLLERKAKEGVKVYVIL